MTGKVPAGRIKAPGDKIRRFREGIPKTIAEVADDGGIDERTVLNLEQGEAVSFHTLEKVAKGLGVRYKALLALARGEIEKLDEEARPRFRITLTVEGDMEEEALEKHRDFLKRIAIAIGRIHPFGDDIEFTKGSVLMSFTMHSDDIERVCQAFVDGRLEQFGIREFRVEFAKRRFNILLINPSDTRDLTWLTDAKEIQATVVRDISEVASLAQNPALDAIVVDPVAVYTMHGTGASAIPLLLCDLNAAGIPILILGLDGRHVHPMYAHFPAVDKQNEVLPKLIQWANPTRRRRSATTQIPLAAAPQDESK